MKNAAELKMGSKRVGFMLSDNADLLSISEPKNQVTEKSFAAALDHALSSQPLRGSRVAVVVADKTRLCGYDRYLPVLLDRLEAQGAKPAHITNYIAYGTHPIQSDKESRATYGDLFFHYRFVHNDCTDDTRFAHLGTTTRGTPIRILKDILDTDIVITFGAISHHYFAGYGGGRKLIFPGLGQRKAIYRNHSLFLDRQNRTLAAGCRPGRLRGNPLAEDLAEIESYWPADLAIHGILNSHGTVCRLMVGSGVDHFHRACECHGKHCEMVAAGGYALVVASCGGYPKDINFIQAHKAVHHAADFVKEGGALIVLAQCRDGIGSRTFLPWFDMGGWDQAFEALLQSYQGNGGTALAMMEKTRRIDIFMVTDLSREDCRSIGVKKLDQQSAVRMVNRYSGSLAVIPNASLLVRQDPINHKTNRQITNNLP